MKSCLVPLFLFYSLFSHGQDQVAPSPDQPVTAGSVVIPDSDSAPAPVDDNGSAVPVGLSAEMKANNIGYENNNATQQTEAQNNLEKARAEEFKTLEGATPQFLQESQLDARAAIEGAKFSIRSLDVSPTEKGEVRLFNLSASHLKSLGVSQSQLESMGLSPSVIETQGISLSQIEELGIPMVESIAISPTETGAKVIAAAPVEDPKDIERKRKACERLRGPSQYDSRIEIAQLNPALPCHVSIYNNSRSVAMIVEKENLSQLSSELFQLNTGATLGTRYKLCDNEPFVEQIVVGVGTGFIIAEDIMMTAGHVFQRPLSDYVVIFGYKVINKLGTAETSIAVNDIYYPVEITENLIDYDMVKFRVDRKFENAPLQWENSLQLEKGTEVYMIGYPCGLPQKLAINSDIYNNEDRHFFYAYLDSYQGNSGSPVFNYNTHKIIGVLVSGHLDYEYTGNCYQSVLYEPTDCPGEKAMRIELAFEE